MLDLAQMTEDFIRKDFSSYRKYDAADESVLLAVGQTNMKMDERENCIIGWLHSYMVLHLFPPENRKLVARQILDFADNGRTATRSLHRDVIVAEYQKLSSRLSAAAPKTKLGNLRNVGSLTSKALWCCYPFDVPIMDDFAERALQVISRLSDIQLTRSAKSKSDKDRYKCFLEVWFLVYDRVSLSIDAADLKNYPYKIRVLDRLLWHLGQPNYDTVRGVT